MAIFSLEISYILNKVLVRKKNLRKKIYKYTSDRQIVIGVYTAINWNNLYVDIK